MCSEWQIIKTISYITFNYIKYKYENSFLSSVCFNVMCSGIYYQNFHYIINLLMIVQMSIVTSSEVLQYVEKVSIDKDKKRKLLLAYEQQHKSQNKKNPNSNL